MVEAVPSVSVEEHLAHILTTVAPLPPVSVALPDALGRTLARSVTALVEVPGFDNSAMDGYAVRAADVAGATPDSPVALTVIADLPAGSAEDPPLAPGTTARIMTGAAIPHDADCVVPLENTDEGTETVLIRTTETGRSHIRRAGSDVHSGDLVLTAARQLTSRDIAAAAAVGHATLEVHPAPRVAVLSTGSELMPPGAALARGRIHDSNSYLLAAAVAEAGGIPVRLGAIPDDEGELRAAFERYAGQVDAFVTSGGVSVGAYDVVKAVLAPLGTVQFGPVRMQPGKPQGFGSWIDGTPIFALPGNPLSVIVSFENFVRPALRRMQGLVDLERPTVAAVAVEGWRSPLGRAQYIPIVVLPAQPSTAAQFAGQLRVRPASGDGSASHLVASLAHADGIALVGEEVGEVRAGDTVTVSLLTS